MQPEEVAAMRIRDAVADDWPAIWPIVRAVVAAGDTYCWPVETSEDAAREWWTGKPDGRVFVAEEDGDVLGTAELHPNQPAGGSHVANAGFMVALSRTMSSHRPFATDTEQCSSMPS